MGGVGTRNTGPYIYVCIFFVLNFSGGDFWGVIFGGQVLGF